MQKLVMVQNKSGFSTVIIVLLILTVAIAVVYFVIINSGGTLDQYIPGLNKRDTIEDQITKDLSTQSDSDEVGAIEKDLSNTNLDSLDSGVEQTSVQ